MSAPPVPFFIRITLLFTGGVFISLNFRVSEFMIIAISLVVVTLVLFHRKWMIYPAVFMAGIIQSGSDRPIGKGPVDQLLVDFENSRPSTRVKGRVLGLFAGEKWQPVNESVMLFSQDSLPAGKVRILLSDPYIKDSPRYPTKAVFASDICVLSADHTLVQQLQGWVSHRLEKFLDSDNRGLGMGIFLGNKSFMDPALYALYQRAGGAHILAVSGLHVGIVFGFLFFVSRRAGNRRRSLIFRYSLIAVFIWTYAALTGFAPSVVRSTGFLSLVLLSQLRHAPVTLPHTLFLLLFLVGCLAPETLLSVGLQLSYLAVAGIMIFQPIFERILRGWPHPIAWAGRMVSVSVSAQILTIPVLSHYFGGISLAGGISSLVLIPYAFVALLLVLLLFLFGDVPVFRALINDCFAYFTGMVNDALQWITGFRYSYIEAAMTWPEIISYYIVLILLYACIRWPGKYVFGSLMIILIWVVARV